MDKDITTFANASVDETVARIQRMKDAVGFRVADNTLEVHSQYETVIFLANPEVLDEVDNILWFSEE